MFIVGGGGGGGGGGGCTRGKATTTELPWREAEGRANPPPPGERATQLDPGIITRTAQGRVSLWDGVGYLLPFRRSWDPLHKKALTERGKK